MTELPNPFGAERRVYSWRGYSIAYVVQGNGPAVVLVHSIHAAAWAMEWRFVQPALVTDYRVFVLDLIGFGASSRPPLHYSGALFIALLQDFLRDVVKAPATLVGSSLGGTYSVAVAAETPALVRAVCAIGPAGVTRLQTPGGAGFGLIERLLRSPVVGARLFDTLTSMRFIGFFLRDIYSSPDALPKDSKALYWETARLPGARFAPAAFVGMKLNYDIRPLLPAVRCPLLLAWGKDAGQTPASESGQVRALAPTSQFALLPGGDLPHEERPAEFVQALRQFLAALP